MQQEWTSWEDVSGAEMDEFGRGVCSSTGDKYFMLMLCSIFNFFVTFLFFLFEAWKCQLSSDAWQQLIPFIFHTGFYYPDYMQRVATLL